MKKKSEWITVYEATEILNVPRSKVLKMLKSGRFSILPSIRGGELRISRAHIESYKDLREARSRRRKYGRNN